MSGIFLRWGLPAFLTVVGGTLAAVATSGAAIPQDLQRRTAAVLQESGQNWARVAFDMRDATLSGTAASEHLVEQAVAEISAVRGVRSVSRQVVIAELARPFPFIASVEDGTITLSGGLPDEAMRAELLALAGSGARDELRVLAGAPEQAKWLAAARYVVAYAKDFDEGEAALSDLDITISGRARDLESFEALNALAELNLPTGLNLSFRELQPPMASPYEWRADFDGKRLSVAGAIPSEQFGIRLLDGVPDAVGVTTSLVLASGAPSAFESNAENLLSNLLRLQSGTATISDTKLALTGSPGSPAVADAVRIAMTPSGANVTLGPPQVEEYWFSAERHDDALVLDGFVPDAATKARLAGLAGADVGGLELGRGAPERFVSGVDFVVAALGRMSEGTASITGTVIALDGRAATIADYAAIEATLDQGAPQGLQLGVVDIGPPLATPYLFAAEKSETGDIVLTGYVPSTVVRRALLAALPVGATESLSFAGGEPDAFAREAPEGLKLLFLLDSGRVNFDGTSWMITGAVGAPEAANVAETAFASAGLASAGWGLELTVPVVAEISLIEPYSWAARKLSSGQVELSGYLPSEDTRSLLAERAGAGLIDNTALGAGAPETFGTEAVAALEALRSLDEGEVDLAGGNWTLTGRVATTAGRHVIARALLSAVNPDDWHIAIQAADAAPVVTPFVWSAAKADDGRITLSGYVPTDQVRNFIAVRADKVAADSTLVGSGEPERFSDDALAGIEALRAMRSGMVAFDGRKWSIAGQPEGAGGTAAIETALASATGAGAAWQRDLVAPALDAAVAEPVPVEPEPEAVVSVNADEPAPSVETARSYLFQATKQTDSPVSFSGNIPAEAVRIELAMLTETEPSPALTVAGNLPADFAGNAGAGSRALALLTDGSFGLDGQTWVFSGRAESDLQRQSALAVLSSAPGYQTWQSDVTLLPPLEVCQRHVGAFATRNAILFQSGSALIAEQSLPALDELAGYLAVCPEATVNVEGHTDTDGDADANLALSVSRAEAVVDALIIRGVGPERLYAIGYGESLPMATNETRAGKQANRRIAFILAGE